MCGKIRACMWKMFHIKKFHPKKESSNEVCNLSNDTDIIYLGRKRKLGI